MRHIYLDHAATTPLDPRVLESMMPYLTEQYGNASSVHALGRKARFAVEESREQIAAHLGAEPGEIIFTSGGTEANNLALKGTLGGAARGLVTSAVEHEAVLRPAASLRSRGHPVTELRPNAAGAVSPEALGGALTPEVALVSLMHANNELGTINPIRELAAMCRARRISMHVDAVQTGGYMPLRVDDLGVDLLTLSAHKWYGPKGVGLLYARGGQSLFPLIEGGAQERRRRGGTENVAAIVGMARAFDLVRDETPERATRAAALRNRLRKGIAEAVEPPWTFNTPENDAEAAPHILSVAFPPHEGRAVDGEMLLLNLDVEGIRASAGSACTSGAVEPSHVLLAVGLDRATAAAAVRFSVGKDNTDEEIDYTVEVLAGILKRMRG